MPLDNLAVGKEFGLRHGFKFCMGVFYMGGFIGDDKSKHEWIKDWTSKWENKFVQSLKQQENIPRRVMSGCFV